MEKEKLNALLFEFKNIEGVIKYFMRTILQMHYMEYESQIELNIKYNFDKIINQYECYENYSLIKYMNINILMTDLYFDVN